MEKVPEVVTRTLAQSERGMAEEAKAGVGLRVGEIGMCERGDTTQPLGAGHPLLCIFVAISFLSNFYLTMFNEFF